MGHAICLGGAADTMAWATLSFEQILSIASIFPNAPLRELPKVSGGINVMPWICCQLFCMGTGRYWYYAHNILQWVLYSTWEVSLILRHVLHCPWGEVEETLHLAMISLNAALTGLPNVSAGLSIIPWMCSQLHWMGPGRHWMHLNGPCILPGRCRWYYGIGRILLLLSIALIFTNVLLRELPNMSAGPIVIPSIFCQLHWMGPRRH
jgi:hypothetical protein